MRSARLTQSLSILALNPPMCFFPPPGVSPARIVRSFRYAFDSRHSDTDPPNALHPVPLETDRWAVYGK